MTMSFKELLLLYITIQGFISYIPQMYRLIKRKSSEDMSVSSWVIWSSNSIIYLLYLILSSENIWLILSQLLEVLLVSGTLIIVIVLRRNKQ